MLLENHDLGTAYAAERVLERGGYDVAVCGGPDHLARGRCSLLATGACDLIEGADVVFHSLNLDRVEHRRVLTAIRSHYPDVPVVVEAPTPSAERHRQLLHGRVTIATPARGADVLDGVRRALSGEPGTTP